MNQLKKPRRMDFPGNPYGSFAMQTADGAVFLAVYESECGQCRLWRWEGGGDWTALSVLPGKILEENINQGFPERRWCFNDPARSELVFLMARREQSPSLVLAAVGYDGTLHSETPADDILGDSIIWISRFPNGDYLMYGWYMNDIYITRIALDGTVRWRQERPRPFVWDETQKGYHLTEERTGEVERAVALADDTTLLITCHKSPICLLERLGSAGERMNVPEALQVSSFPTPDIGTDGAELILEDRQDEEFGRFQRRFRYRRRTLDREWRVQRERTAEFCTDDILAAHTFFPDGVLVRTGEMFSTSGQVHWIPFDGPARVLLDMKSTLPETKLNAPVLDLPALRTADGVFMFALQERNAEARFTLLACAPDGEVLWMKKFSSERWRRIYLRGDELLVLTWGRGKGQDRIRADAFRLPSREEQP